MAVTTQDSAQGPAPAAQPHAVGQERAGVLELAVGGLVLRRSPFHVCEIWWAH
ncbi:hypothetical protein ACFWJ5_10975 [Streptomyces qaidamensis]|uniref:hypothetical protein n=1 Tax=Streptomyces qaidamensis TaxID=1783515 RepID=UPI0036648042